MTTFDDFAQTRVMRTDSMQLRQDSGETVLCPVPGSFSKKFIILTAVFEFFAFTGILLYFMIGPGDMEKNMLLMIGLLFGVGFIVAPVIVGAVLFDTFAAMQKIRFRRTPNGTITVKDFNKENVVLHGEEPKFTLESTIDRDGDEVHDLFLKYGPTMHYIVSGTDPDAMNRLRDELQNACR